MTSWRMSMRDAPGGENMFKKCHPMNLAAITYDSLLRTDLRRYSPENLPPGWKDLKAPQKGSIKKFAWKIQAGDRLYIRDSDHPNLLVGFGYVLGNDGEPAYFYDEDSPIKTAEGVVWRHLIRVDWERRFSEIPYKDRSPNTTVLELDEGKLSEFQKGAKKLEYQEHGLPDAEVDLAESLETAYPRATPATIRLILPKHVTLSKQFQAWLQNHHSIQGHREHSQIDMQFKIGRDKAMAEFKIAYNGNTKAAVREALGQILEYNHYPGRKKAEAWFLVLDEEPSSRDCTFVKSLRETWGCPIYLGWRRKAEFSFYPDSPLG